MIVPVHLPSECARILYQFLLTKEYTPDPSVYVPEPFLAMTQLCCLSCQLGWDCLLILKVVKVNTRTIASDLTDQGVEIILAQEIRFLGYVPEPI